MYNDTYVESPNTLHLLAIPRPMPKLASEKATLSVTMHRPGMHQEILTHSKMLIYHARSLDVSLGGWCSMKGFVA